MKILVTGGSGFVGSHLVPCLLNDGHSVTNVDVVLPTYPSLPDVYGRYTTRWQAVDEIPPSLLCDYDVIIHLASVTDVPFSITSPRQTFVANALSTLHLLKSIEIEASRNHRPAFILFSTDSVYGKTTNKKITENDPLNPPNPYAVSKVAAELLSKMYAENHGLDVTIFRCSMMIGERARMQGVVPIFTRQALANQPITIQGDGSTTKDINYVGNTVSAVRTIIDSISTSRFSDNTIRSYNVFNIASGRPISIENLAKEIIKQTNSHSTIEYKAWRPGEEGVHNKISIAKAKRILHYNPIVTPQQALSRTIEWIKRDSK